MALTLSTSAPNQSALVRPTDQYDPNGIAHATNVGTPADTKADRATEELARIYGEPEVLKGYGRRNTTTCAIAPTTSSSAILGQTSPGIEPFASNYYKAGLSKGNFIRMICADRNKRSVCSCKRKILVPIEGLL